MFSEKVSRIFMVMVSVYAIGVIASGILGGLCYNKTGWYPMWSDAFPILFGAETKDMIHLNDSFDFMTRTDASGFIDLAFIACTFVLAIIINFTEIPVKAVIAIIDLIGVSTLEIIAMNNQNERWFGAEPMLIASGVAVLGLIISVFCFKRTTGGIFMLVGIGGFIFKNILVPVIMWFAFLSTVSKIGVLIGVIVFVVIMVVKLPAGATGSSDLVTDAAIRDAVKEEVKAEMKNQERKAVLENRIAACRRGIKGKQEGSWNYAHVDVNVTRKQIEKDMKELEQLS